MYMGWSPVQAVADKHAHSCADGVAVAAGSRTFHRRVQPTGCKYLLPNESGLAVQISISEDENSGLLPGLRGAGTSFGIVTEVTFKLYVPCCHSLPHSECLVWQLLL